MAIISVECFYSKVPGITTVITMQDSQQDQNSVQQEQIEILFRNASSTSFITLLNSGFVYLVLHRHMDSEHLIIWFICLAILVLARVVTASLFWRQYGDFHRTYRYYIVYLLLLYGSATSWGLLIYLPLSSDIIWMHAFISFVIAGMSAGGMITLSVSLMAAIPYLLLMLLPFSYFFMAFNSLPHLSMGIMGILYLVMMLHISVQTSSLIRNTIMIKSKNEELYQFLKKSSQKTFYQFLEKTGQTDPGRDRIL